MSFVNDTFTASNGTALESHTADSGAAWTKHASSPGGAQIDSNAVHATVDLTVAVYYSAAVPAAADYYVEAEVTFATAANAASGVAGRVDTSALTLYFARFAGSAITGTVGQLQLFKTVAGSSTNLGTWDVSPSNNDTATVRLTMIGTTISASWNGTQRISVTDSAISAAGRPGLRLGRTAANDSVDNWSAVNVGYDSIATNNSNFVAGLTPYNWYASGSAHVISQHTPAGIEFSFTGTYCALAVDVSAITGSGLTATEWPRLRYSVDNGAWTETQLTSATVSVVVATGLASATHTVDLWLYATNSLGENWTTPANALKITGITLVTGESIAARTLPTDSALIFGDSLARGKGLRTTAAPTGEGNEAWSMALAKALDCRPGIIGISGQGWSNAGAGGEPNFQNSWNLYSSGKSRLSGGVFTPTPAYIFICQGSNDAAAAVSDATVQTAVEATVPGIRTAAPSVPIFVLIPFGQFKKSAILAGLVTVGGTAITRTIGTGTIYRYPSDSNLYALDLGTTASLGLTTAPGASATQQAYDGLHPNEYAIPALATRIGGMVRATLSGVGPPMSRVMTGM